MGLEQNRRTNQPRGSLLGALLLGAVLVIALAAMAGPALAARGGGGARQGGNQSSTATVTLAPNPVPSGTQFTITGTGFYPNRVIYVTGNCSAVFNLVADSEGNLFYHGTAGNPGTCSWTYSQSNGRKVVQMATITLTIV